MIDEQLGLMPFDNSGEQIKELFSIEDIEGKTELTGEQVMILSRIEILHKKLKDKFGIENYSLLVDSFLRKQLSKDRGSRTEFVNSLRSMNDVETGNFLEKIGNKFGK